MSLRAYSIALVATVVGLLLIFRQVRRGRLAAKYALIWTTAAGVTLLMAAIPGLLDRVASVLGVAYGPTVLLVAGLIFFSALSVQFSSEITKLEERTRILAEEVALLRNEVENGHLATDVREATKNPNRSKSVDT